MYTIYFPNGKSQRAIAKTDPQLGSIFWICRCGQIKHSKYWVNCKFQFFEIVELSQDSIYVDEISQDQYEKLICEDYNKYIQFTIL
jgi:hypothetical protein